MQILSILLASLQGKGDILSVILNTSEVTSGYNELHEIDLKLGLD